MEYTDKLKNPHWQRKRLEIMQRDDFTCQMCKDTETTLNIHHKKYFKDKEPWDIDNKYLITLCEDCHNEIEQLKNDNKNLIYNKIRIYKSNNWQEKNFIMFVSYKEICSMRIYNKNKEFIIGFNLCGDDLFNIPVILKYSLNGKKIY